MTDSRTYGFLAAAMGVNHAVHTRMSCTSTTSRRRTRIRARPTPALTFARDRGYVWRASGDEGSGPSPKREPCAIQGLPRSGVTSEDRVIGHWVCPGRRTVGALREVQRRVRRPARVCAFGCSPTTGVGSGAGGSSTRFRDRPSPYSAWSPRPYAPEDFRARLRAPIPVSFGHVGRDHRPVHGRVRRSVGFRAGVRRWRRWWWPERARGPAARPVR